MQFFQTKFQKSFVLSTKKRIKCFPWKNPVDSRWKSGDITRTIEAANIAPLALTVLWVRVNCCRIRLRLKYTKGKTSFFCSMEVLKSFNREFQLIFSHPFQVYRPATRALAVPSSFAGLSLHWQTHSGRPAPWQSYLIFDFFFFLSSIQIIKSSKQASKFYTNGKCARNSLFNSLRSSAYVSNREKACSYVHSGTLILNSWDSRKAGAFTCTLPGSQEGLLPNGANGAEGDSN